MHLRGLVDVWINDWPIDAFDLLYWFELIDSLLASWLSDRFIDWFDLFVNWCMDLMGLFDLFIDWLIDSLRYIYRWIAIGIEFDLIWFDHDSCCFCVCFLLILIWFDCLNEWEGWVSEWASEWVNVMTVGVMRWWKDLLIDWCHWFDWLVLESVFDYDSDRCWFRLIGWFSWMRCLLFGIASMIWFVCRLINWSTQWFICRLMDSMWCD